MLVLALGSLSLHVLTQNLISDLGSTDMISLLRLGKMALNAALLVELADATFLAPRRRTPWLVTMGSLVVCVAVCTLHHLVVLD